MSGAASGPDGSQEGLDTRWGSKPLNTLVWKGSMGLAAGIILRTGLQFANVQWVGRGLLWGGLGGVTVGLLELNDCLAAVKLRRRQSCSRRVDWLVATRKRRIGTGIAYVVAMAASVAILWKFTEIGERAGKFVGAVTGAIGGYWVVSTVVGYSLVACRSPERVRHLDQHAAPSHPFPIN